VTDLMPLNVLIVEDDESIRKMLVAFLSDEGMSVSAASNGKEALEQLRQGLNPKVILLDLLMPVMDGYEFLANRKHEQRLLDIPILVWTAVSSTMREALVGPKISVISKPSGIDDLVTIIREKGG
jgi:CheY-like chemotaxis protein